MAKAGARMVSQESGETFIFVQTRETHGGDLLIIDVICEPGGGAKGAPIHIHPKQVERFTIQSGVMEYVLNGKTGRACAGDTIVMPPGTAHTFRNPSRDEKLVFRFEYQPAGGMEYIFENMTALSQMGKLRPDGKAPLLPSFRVLHQYPDNLYFAGIPIWIQKIGIAVGAFTARLLGYPAYYQYDEAAHPNNPSQPIPEIGGTDQNYLRLSRK
ncbi:MAG: cupin domain-containing protein [Anaerolineae bacterium]|nr:cupin domain-containing protein [Anaerolineae bacterium]